jgi:predicted amidohydrolase
MKVAALQMVSGVSVEANLARAGVLLADAAAQGAELAVLPEYFCLMGRKDTDKLQVREPHGQGPVQAFLAAQGPHAGPVDRGRYPAAGGQR